MSTKQFARNVSIYLALAILFVAGVFLMSGCTAVAPSPAPEASVAAQPSDEPEVVAEVEEEPAFDGTIPFGEVATYDDEVSVSVSVPGEYVPSEYAAGMVEGQPVLAFEFVITNGSNEPFDPTTVFATMSSGGVEASGVFDTENSVGFPPSTSVLPGQTIKWVQAWSVTDPANLTMDISVGFTYDNIIYTNIQ